MTHAERYRNPQNIRTLFLVAQGGPDGFGILFLGVLLTLWGLLNLVLVRNRFVLFAQAVLSFLPLGLGVLALWNGLSLFRTIGSPPGMEVVARLVGHAMVNAIFGAVSTGVAAIIGIVALSRNLSAEHTQPGAKNAVGD